MTVILVIPLCWWLNFIQISPLFHPNHKSYPSHSFTLTVRPSSSFHPNCTLTESEPYLQYSSMMVTLCWWPIRTIILSLDVGEVTYHQDPEFITNTFVTNIDVQRCNHLQSLIWNYQNNQLQCCSCWTQTLPDSFFQ